METIYEWLLHNMGNQGNAFTILNVHRQTAQADSTPLEVMARTHDYAVVTVLIQPVKADSSDADRLHDRPATHTIHFASTEQLLDYLSTGNPPDAATNQSASGFRVSVFEPHDGADQIVFPQE
ncbi:hypothetical protein GGR92_000305 [Spirosoma lacussanchae]|uniref:hypothetical protein n=1 Tax=Spirosoma lacussanchae TaxID=1884249 RepID=UPI001108C93E|nr:hypothetical protein [Spirosoma lacussanchae]